MRETKARAPCDFRRRPAPFTIRRGIIVLVLLALPYLIVPLYRFVDPVSTPMLWRFVTGSRVERIFVPFSRIAPTLPLAVIIAEDGTLLPQSRHRPRRHARSLGTGRRRYRRSARRLDHHPADRQEPVFVAGPQLRPQSAGNTAGAVDQPGAAEAPRARNLSQHRRVGPEWRIRRRGRRPLGLRQAGTRI